MSLLRANCPGCSKRHRLPREEAGKPIVCIACGTWFAMREPLLGPIGQGAREGDQSPTGLMGLIESLAAESPAEMPRHFTFENHDVVVVQGVEESTWGTYLAVGCAVLLLGTFITVLSMPGKVYPHLSALKHRFDSHPASVQPISRPAVAIVPTTVPSAPVTPAAEIAPPTIAPSTQPKPNQEKAQDSTVVIAAKPADAAVIPSDGAANRPAVADNLLPPDMHPPVLVRPAIQPLTESAEDLSDREIGQSIQRGVDYLIKQFNSNDFEIVPDHGERTSQHTGMDALFVYAILQAGQASNDPRLSPHGPFINGILDTLKRLPMTGQVSDRTTYARALRATVLAVYDRPLDHEFLKRDAAWLMANQRHGAYTYASPIGSASGTVWDNSNSQYGLLGVWAAAEAGVEVPNSYWQAVEKHWNECQLPSGGWEYVESHSSPGSLSMTCAGVASLLVTHDWLENYRNGLSVGREPFSPELRRGLAWLEDGDRILNSTSMYWGYTLYGIERVGLASGLKYLGQHNWYPELCKQVMDRQQADGSFGDAKVDESGSDINTAYALIFLSRGRHPILMNKLRFNGNWSNRPRDLANLSKVASHDLERPLNWQVVSLDHDWVNWTDSPVLYIASDEKPHLDESAVEKLRNFALAGGMLFLHADGASRAFDAGARELAAQLFPQYPLMDVPADHPVYTALYRMQSPLPPLKMISNGARALLMYSPEDLSRYWQTRDKLSPRAKPAFEMGMNLFVYAAGKRDLRNRLESSWIAAAKTSPVFTIPVARLQYAGNWDPEPAAWPRFSNWLQRQTGYGLNVTPVAIRDLDVRQFPFAHLTGTSRLTPNDAEVAALQRYVRAGGVLLIDPCGGISSFDQSIRAELLARAFSRDSLQPITADHPLLSRSREGMELLPRPHLRPFVIDRNGTSNGSGPLMLSSGRGHVIVCPADLTSGLLATNTWGILGYEPGYAQSLLKNAILWTVDGQKDE